MERKKLTRSKPQLSVEDLEKAVEQLNTGKREPAHTAVLKPLEESSKSLYSYNIKLDAQTEQRVKAHIARTGQNMKGFFQIAIREYLERQEA